MNDNQPKNPSPKPPPLTSGHMRWQTDCIVFSPFTGNLGTIVLTWDIPAAMSGHELEAKSLAERWLISEGYTLVALEGQRLKEGEADITAVSPIPVFSAAALLPDDTKFEEGESLRPPGLTPAAAENPRDRTGGIFGDNSPLDYPASDHEALMEKAGLVMDAIIRKEDTGLKFRAATSLRVGNLEKQIQQALDQLAQLRDGTLPGSQRVEELSQATDTLINSLQAAEIVTGEAQTAISARLLDGEDALKNLIAHTSDRFDRQTRRAGALEGRIGGLDEKVDILMASASETAVRIEQKEQAGESK